MARSNARIPMIALDYSEKDKAVKKEIMIDYTNGAIYVVSSYDKNVIFNLTDSIMQIIKEQGLEAGDMTIYIEGVGDLNLGDVINQLYGNQVEIVDTDPNGIYIGKQYQYDLKSVLVKDSKIQIKDFDIAPERTIPQKFGGVIRWVPIEEATSGDTPDSGSVVAIVPDSNKNIALQASGKQYTLLGQDEEVYTVQLPTIATAYNRFVWNLTITDLVPTVTFPSNVKWEYDSDTSLQANTSNIIELTTWDQGMTWLGRNVSYGAVSDDFVTKQELEDSYFDTPQVTELISWKQN